MNYLITGGTGFIGSALCAYLLKNDHSVVLQTRKPDCVGNKGVKAVRDLSELGFDEVFDVVINLSGEPIANRRWSKKQKQKIIDSRLITTQKLVTFMSKLKRKPEVFVSSSAIGYYGIERSDEGIAEGSKGDNSFSSRLCAQWEQVAMQTEGEGIRTCLLRTGVVLGVNGGALKKMLPPFSLGLGGNIGSGEQWMSWIHIDDILGIIEYCVSRHDLSGPINCTAPSPVTNATFTTVLGRVLKRPVIFPMPTFVVKVLFGEMGKELLLAGKKVLPIKLKKSDFSFKYTHLDAALADIVEKNKIK